MDRTNSDDGFLVSEMVARGEIGEGERALALLDLARDSRDNARAQRDICRASLSAVTAHCAALRAASEKVLAVAKECDREHGAGQYGHTRAIAMAEALAQLGTTLDGE